MKVDLSQVTPLADMTEIITPDNLPDNWYAWNLLTSQETYNNNSNISRTTNWAHNNNTPDASREIFASKSVSLAFFKPAVTNEVTDYMYPMLKLDFTPLTLGGLYVEAGARGKSKSDKTDRGFSILPQLGTSYLNILSKEDQDYLTSAGNGSALDNTRASSAVTFTINEDFSFGSTSNKFTAINIYSDWNINIISGKSLTIFGEMIGGEGKTITLAGGGSFILNNTNASLTADWVLKDNSTIFFDKSATGLVSTNLLGKGDITVSSSGGRLVLAGGNTVNISNNVRIEAGGTFTTHEQNKSPYSYDRIVWVNMTGDISGDGDWFRSSDGGRDATNEMWVFTGDNSGFRGNWYTTADVHYGKDKDYSFLPMVFGNGGIFEWDGVNTDAFYRIAGYGSIIGGQGQSSRKGMGVGFNYNSDVILFNNLEGHLKVKHLSNKILELRGNNTHIYGTYAEAGGTIRFGQASNLGMPDPVKLADGSFISTGASIVLNNDSTISYSGAGSESIKNALFNTMGKWNITVEQQTATLNWDMSTNGIYDRGRSDGLESGSRTGAFTKKGKGTLNVTAGELLTASNTVFVQEGTLAFSGTGTWGKATVIILGNETTLRSDRTMTISGGVRLTTDKTAEVSTSSTVDGSLTLGNGGIIEFVMGSQQMAEGASSLFNIFNITGDFNVNLTSKQEAFQFTFLNGLYVTTEGFYKLLTAGNDLRNIDLSKIGLKGLPETDSRQTYQLYASGTADWTDKNGNVHSEAYGNADGKELYLYASPDIAKLIWNRSTGGNWEVKGDDSNKESWTGHDKDSRFYNNDSVYFRDNAGDTPGAIKTINLTSDVNPSHVNVSGSGHYEFRSEGGFKITGQGDLFKDGDGILDIYTSNTYSAGTVIKGGTVNAYAANSFGTGLIRLENNSVLNIWADEALGTADITITGGILNLHSTNSATRNATLNGGTIYAYGTDSLGAGTLNVQNGNVYAREENAIGGNVILSGSSSHLYTQSVNALGNTTVTVSNGAMIHSAIDPKPGWSMGNGSSIILSNGGILEVNSSTALNTLSRIKFDGGEMRIDNRMVDATGFAGMVELVNTKQAIINTIGAQSQLKLSGQLGTMINADILKIGGGELVGVLSGDFRARMEIREGKGHLHQGYKDGTTEYTNYLFNGVLSGKGTMEFSGGSISVTADTSSFNGLMYVNLDSNDLNIRLIDDHNRKRSLYDVTVNKGSIAILDSSGENMIFWGNLASGADAEADQATIGFGKDQLSESIRLPAVINITQTRDDTFKGTFVNGGTKGNLTTNINKNGSATLTLSNDSTTLGTLTINEGAIRLGDGGATGYWAGQIINNSTLGMDYGNVVKTYGSEISGSGSMEISTAGTVVFTAANTYAGGTRINKGTVELRDAGTLGSGDIFMAGTSKLDVANTNGAQNRTIRVVSNTNASIKTASLGETGSLTTAESEGAHAAISVKGGTLDSISLVTTNGKATLSGLVSGSSITLDASATATTPILSNMHLGLGSSAISNGGSSSIINRLTVSYGANAITGSAGNREIIDAKLVLGSGGYDLGKMSALSINIDQGAIASLGDEERFSIHLFGKDADMSKVFSGENTSGLRSVILDEFLKNEGWSVSRDSLGGDNAWWKNGVIVLMKNQPVPEPSGALLILSSVLFAGLRRKRRF